MRRYRAANSWAHALRANRVMWLVVYEPDPTEEAENFREDLSNARYSHSQLAGDVPAKQRCFVGYGFLVNFHFSKLNFWETIHLIEINSPYILTVAISPAPQKHDFVYIVARVKKEKSYFFFNDYNLQLHKCEQWSRG